MSNRSDRAAGLSVVGRTNTIKKVRDRVRTTICLTDAITALAEEKFPISVVAVAARADVTPSLIHNTYPEIAKRIRELRGRSRPRLESRDLVDHFKAENERLRKSLKSAEDDLKAIASENATLIERLKEVTRRPTP